MIPSSLEYHKASDIGNAIQLLEKYGAEAKLLAGGHSLIPAMKLKLNQPGHLIDISKIDALNSISFSDNSIQVGSACTHDQLANGKEFEGRLSMFRDAANGIGDIQVRNMGTIGGSLAHADPAADWPAVVLASNAFITCQGVNGIREISATDFFTGFFTTALFDDEMIITINIPKPDVLTNSAYVKFEQPASRFAIVGCAVSLETSEGICQNIRIAYTGVSDAAFRDYAAEKVLTGNSLTKEIIAAACAAAAENVPIQSDHFASDTYRKHLAKVYLKRALKKAMG